MIKELDLDRVEELASLGLNLGEIAGAMGVSRATLDRRRDENGEIDERITTGKSRGIAEVAAALKNNAVSGDTTACKLFLNAVAGWSTTKKIEHSGEVNAPSIVINMPTPA